MRHFLDLNDYSSEKILQLIELAVELKRELKSGGNHPHLAGKSIALLFQKPSLRTRTSFEIGIVQLGGYAITLGPQEVKMGVRETPADVARALSGYVDGIMARVLNHGELVELAEYASVPIINGLSDYNHPVQAFSDMLTIYERFGRIDGIKVTYVGDGNNVARSLLWASMLTGVQLSVVTPAGYGLTEDDYDRADRLKHGSASFEAFHDPQAAVKDADVIYTDVWTSMGQEDELEDRMATFPPYQVNSQLVAQANSDCIVMHCLPARRGLEITSDVADGPHSVIFQQAENRMHGQKAILVDLLT